MLEKTGFHVRLTCLHQDAIVHHLTSDRHRVALTGKTRGRIFSQDLLALTAATFGS